MWQLDLHLDFMVRSQISAAFLSEDLELIAKVGSDDIGTWCY